jgi:rhodanese-related sulfurtransferase
MGQPAAVAFVDARTVAGWAASGGVTLYDVREPHEFAAERIAGARLAPLSAFDPVRVRPDAGTRLVLHCAAGIRCGRAAELLRASGYDGEVLRLAGGLKAWRAEGLPTER